MKRERRSIRLSGYDYSKNGYYYITICVQEKVNLLGEIVNGEMMLNRLGKMVEKYWLWLAKQYNYVNVNEYVIMPNHLHGILIIDHGRGGSRTAPTKTKKVKPLGRLIGAFKTVSTKHGRLIESAIGPRLWQRNYYEHIIRNEREYIAIRQYIQDNPINWEKDELFCEL